VSGEAFIYFVFGIVALSITVGLYDSDRVVEVHEIEGAATYDDKNVYITDKEGTVYEVIKEDSIMQSEGNWTVYELKSGKLVFDEEGRVSSLIIMVGVVVTVIIFAGSIVVFFE